MDTEHEPMTESELTAFLQKLRAVTGSLTPKEQRFLQGILQSGLATAELDDVHGHSFTLRSQSERVYFPATWATNVGITSPGMLVAFDNTNE